LDCICRTKFIKSATIGEIKSLLGVKAGGPSLPEKTQFGTVNLPDEFDSRIQWPDCPTIKVIRDQSACGTCWAFGAAEAISDRYCVSGVNVNFTVSAADIGFCCGFSCGDGCDGGYPSGAWSYWVSKGVVDEDCYPYPFPSCDHHVPNSKNPCPSSIYPTPSCPRKCNNGKDWTASKHFGAKSYSVRGEQNIMDLWRLLFLCTKTSLLIKLEFIKKHLMYTLEVMLLSLLDGELKEELNIGL
jgi:cathepsin B